MPRRSRRTPLLSAVQPERPSGDSSARTSFSALSGMFSLPSGTACEQKKSTSGCTVGLNAPRVNADMARVRARSAESSGGTSCKAPCLFRTERTESTAWRSKKGISVSICSKAAYRASSMRAREGSETETATSVPINILVSVNTGAVCDIAPAREETGCAAKAPAAPAKVRARRKRRRDIFRIITLLMVVW